MSDKEKLIEDSFLWVERFFKEHSMPCKAMFLSRLFSKRAKRLGYGMFSDFLREHPYLICKVTRQGGLVVVPKDLFQSHFEGANDARIAYWNRFEASAD